MEGDGRAEKMLSRKEQAEAEKLLGMLEICTYGQKIKLKNYLQMAQVENRKRGMIDTKKSDNEKKTDERRRKIE